MMCRRYFHRTAGRLAGICALLAIAGTWAAAAAGVDVQVIVVSPGRGPDRVSVTYAGPVAREQANQDLQSLSAALNRQAADVGITTKRIARSAPEMTSVEATYAEIVNRAEGRLLVQPFVDVYRRYSHLRLTYFIDGKFKLVSPAKPFESGDVRLAVDNQGALVNYDVRIRHTGGAAARIPAVDGAGSWTRLLIPVLFLVLLIAAAIAVAVYLLLRRSGAPGTSAT